MIGATQVGVANPHPGTYSDVNCPSWCWFAGNLLDTSLSNSCIPCHTICANGYAWDSASLQCVPSVGAKSGVAVDPNVPADNSAPVDCPGYCSWVPAASSLFTECVPCSGSGDGAGLTTGAWIAIGLAAYLLLRGRG